MEGGRSPSVRQAFLVYEPCAPEHKQSPLLVNPVEDGFRIISTLTGPIRALGLAGGTPVREASIENNKSYRWEDWAEVRYVDLSLDDHHVRLDVPAEVRIRLAHNNHQCRIALGGPKSQVRLDFWEWFPKGALRKVDSLLVGGSVEFDIPTFHGAIAVVGTDGEWHRSLHCYGGKFQTQPRRECVVDVLAQYGGPDPLSCWPHLCTQMIADIEGHGGDRRHPDSLTNLRIAYRRALAILNGGLAQSPGPDTPFYELNERFHLYYSGIGLLRYANGHLGEQSEGLEQAISHLAAEPGAATEQALKYTLSHANFVLNKMLLDGVEPSQQCRIQQLIDQNQLQAATTFHHVAQVVKATPPELLWLLAETLDADPRLDLSAVTAENLLKMAGRLEASGINAHNATDMLWQVLEARVDRFRRRCFPDRQPDAFNANDVQHLLYQAGVRRWGPSAGTFEPPQDPRYTFDGAVHIAALRACRLWPPQSTAAEAAGKSS